jgi:hypothetical protein
VEGGEVGDGMRACEGFGSYASPGTSVVANTTGSHTMVTAGYHGSGDLLCRRVTESMLLVHKERIIDPRGCAANQP